jgi:hypothetical protein
MLASLLLCSVHIPHEAPDSRSTFGDFASDDSVCPRRDYAPVADTSLVADTSPVAGTSPVADTNPVVDTVASGVDTDSRGGTTLVGDTNGAGQRIAVWSFAIV